MCVAIPPFPNTPSWHGAQLNFTFTFSRNPVLASTKCGWQSVIVDWEQDLGLKNVQQGVHMLFVGYDIIYKGVTNWVTNHRIPNHSVDPFITISFIINFCQKMSSQTFKGSVFRPPFKHCYGSQTEILITTKWLKSILVDFPF
jgi:hypothetical protein